MRFLITGGAGFIGTNLVKRLLNDGHEVVSLDNYSTGKKDNEQDGCKYIECDISDSLRRYQAFGLEKYQLEKPDGIFHLAALARIQPSFKHPSNSFDSNARGTQNIVEWARQIGCPIVYAGSSSVHGDVHANPYTFTKWIGEEILKMYSKIYNIQVTITRFYNVYGEHQATEGAYCNVLGIFQRLHSEGRPLTITGDGEQRRDFTYVGDIVDGIVKSMNHMISNSVEKFETLSFELGRGKNYSINEIADAFGENYPTKYIDSFSGEIRNTLNTETSAHEVLGWKPTVDIIEFIKRKYARS